MNNDKVKGVGKGKVKFFLTAEGAEGGARDAEEVKGEGIDKVKGEGMGKVKGIFTTEGTEGTEEVKCDGVNKVKGEGLCFGFDG